MRLMVPPLPAASRPSKTTHILMPSLRTHSCSFTSSRCSGSSSRRYVRPVREPTGPAFDMPRSLLAEPASCLLTTHAREQMLSTDFEQSSRVRVRDATYAVALCPAPLADSSEPIPIRELRR